MQPGLRRRSAWKWRLAVAATALLSSLATPSASAGQALPRLMLVLDGSGSMWGRVDGRPKIEIANEIVRELLADWDPRVELGLVAYGHRREADCDDIESLIPIGPPDPQTFLAAVESIRPVGKTPIGDALAQAAAQLDYRQRTATVILVSDGEETCGVDPCALAKQLEARGIDFTAHVIGFDLSRGESDQLQCLATATGGLFLTARDAQSLRDALGEAVRTATRRVEPGVWIAAGLAAEREPIRDDIAWKIHRLGATAQDDASQALRKPVLEAHRPTLMISLPRGRYRVLADYAGLRGEIEIDVDERTRARHIVGLGGARLELRGVLPAESAGPVHWELRRGHAGAPVVERAEGASHSAVLAAGRYHVSASHAGSRVERSVVLKAGQTLEQRFRFGSGRLVLRAALAEGQAPIEEPIAWEIHPLEAEEAGAVHRELGSSCLARLDQGRYRVTARYGDTTASEEIEVPAGTTRTHTLSLGAGVVRVFGVLPAPGGAVHDPIEWQVQPSGDSGSGAATQSASIASEQSPAHSFVLPAGRYRVSGHIAELAGTGEIDLRAGESISLGVTLRPTQSPAAQRR